MPLILSQDCLSLTRYDEDILYVLCGTLSGNHHGRSRTSSIRFVFWTGDGHGPFGHLVAFRVAPLTPGSGRYEEVPGPDGGEAPRQAELALVPGAATGCRASLGRGFGASLRQTWQRAAQRALLGHLRCMPSRKWPKMWRSLPRPSTSTSHRRAAQTW